MSDRRKTSSTRRYTRRQVLSMAPSAAVAVAALQASAASQAQSVPAPATHDSYTLRIISSHVWRSYWSQIVAGDFGTGATEDLLFYNAESGYAECWNLGDGGALTYVSTPQGLGSGYTHAVTTRLRDDASAEVLFYDRNTGRAAIHASDGNGGFDVLAQYTGFRTSWQQILPLRVPGRTHDSLLFYDPTYRVMEIYNSDGNGGLVFLRSHAVRADWTRIVAGAFGDAGEPGLLFYSASARAGELYLLDSSGDLHLTAVGSNWRSTWTTIVAGRFAPGPTTDLLFYDAGAAEAELYELRGVSMTRILRIGDVSRTATHVVVGNFRRDRLDDLVTYEAPTGQSSVWAIDSWPRQSIEGYVMAQSVAPGGSIGVCVSCKTSTYTARIIRKVGSTGTEQVVRTLPARAGTFRDAPTKSWETGCSWPVSFQIAVPTSWASGLYVCRLTAANNDSTDLPFVVKRDPTSRAKVLVCLASSTYQAYNWWGGKNLYGKGLSPTHGLNWRIEDRSVQLSLERPYLSPTDFHKDELQHWELPMLRWLQKRGVRADVCLSQDLHTDTGLLNRYKVVVFLGHDEYWSKAMRDKLDAYVATGGNAMFLGGNTCYWQVRFEAGNRRMVCYKLAELDPLSSSAPAETTVRWFEAPVRRPESSTTGLSASPEPIGGQPMGGYMPPTAVAGRVSLPYTVRISPTAPYGWVLSGTGLQRNSTFGADALGSVVGYETDGLPFQLDNQGNAVALSTAAHPVTAGTVTILATAQWTYSGLARQATMAMIKRSGGSGTIFHVATTDWARELDQAPVSRITANVLARFTA